MITKELLSEVLGGSVYELNIKGNTVYPIYDNGMPVMNNIPINIYELAHKCKEWASQQDEKYTSFLSGRDTKYDHKPYFVYFPLILDKDGYEKQFRADTEPEAIFKACQWILDNKDKQ